MGCGCGKGRRNSPKGSSYNILDVGKDALKGNLKTVTEDIYKERLNTCLSCEEYNTTFGICNDCKCFVRAKCRYTKSSCPLGKWDATEDINGSDIS